jgi:hypothetical protein
MNPTHTEAYDLSYSAAAPVLVSATSEAAMRRALRTVEASGSRIAAAVPLASACDRFDRQIKASSVWLELDEDPGAAMDEVLESIAAGAADGRFSAVVSSTAALIDPVFARLDGAPIELIADADEPERIAALALATARAGMPHMVSDIASDQSAERLRQLSDEVSRIAATLARLSSGPEAAQQRPALAPGADAPQVSADTVRSVIRARRLRSRFFPEHLFADPAWDMMLDLLQAEIAQLRVPVSSLCIAAAVPATTALRWLKTMVQQGIFLRRADPHDGRRVFVELAPDASRALRRYFAEVGSPPAVI